MAIDAGGLGGMLVVYLLMGHGVTAGCLLAGVFYCRDGVKAVSGYVTETSFESFSKHTG